jgi:hypothetical protein
LILAAGVATFVASAAAADSAEHVNARFFGGSESGRATCQRLVDTRPPPTGSDRVTVSEQVSMCLNLARSALLSTSDTELLETYRAIQALRPWVKGDRLLMDQMSNAAADATAALNARDLLGRTYDAVVRAQLIRADPGGYVGEPPNAPDQGRTSAGVDLAIETKHMALGRSWDFSLTFDAGAQPLFVMVKAPEGNVTPAFVPGVVTSTGFRVARSTRSTETAVVGTIGGARINSDDATFGSTQTESVVVAANDMSRWALFMDGSIDFRWYPRDVWLVHLETEPLDPLFHIFAGVRHDQRFHRSGDLENFSDPTGRIFFGFDINPFRVPGRHAGASVLTIGAGFRFEGALRETDRLPSGYQVALSVNLEVLNALARLKK